MRFCHPHNTLHLGKPDSWNCIKKVCVPPRVAFVLPALLRMGMGMLREIPWKILCEKRENELEQISWLSQECRSLRMKQLVLSVAASQ